MKLTHWVRERGRGAITALLHESHVSNKTIIKAATHGEPVVFEVAEKLAAAVERIEADAVAKGLPAVGLVSVDEIRFGADHERSDSVAPGAP